MTWWVSDVHLKVLKRNQFNVPVSFSLSQGDPSQEKQFSERGRDFGDMQRRVNNHMHSLLRVLRKVIRRPDRLTHSLDPRFDIKLPSLNKLVA